MYTLSLLIVIDIVVSFYFISVKCKYIPFLVIVLNVAAS